MDSKISTQVMQCLESNKGTYNQNDNCDDNNSLVINKALLHNSCIQENLPEGRRIVDDNCDNNSLVIDNKAPLDSSCIQENLPEGCRIVDISHMWNEIYRTFNNHMKGIEC